ncbi:hypothetical protein EWM64_g7042 [Hericium alpestre]|uniref:Uncharacterized protein n=1 Tax=Hericium alpestre TaxID=135208 RepID=A0A4Y9ZRS3_9AGAM|nr:hypothetical protein EWM64_g7042 [Hericium alpestre]
MPSLRYAKGMSINSARGCAIGLNVSRYFDFDNSLSIHLSMAPFTIRIPARPSGAPSDSASQQKNLAAPTTAQPTSRGKDSNVPLPSEGWLRNPAWVDGGVNPPHFYTTAAEIQDAIQLAANAGIMVPHHQTPVQEGEGAVLAAGKGVPAATAQGGPVANVVNGTKAVTAGTAANTRKYFLYSFDYPD